MNICTSCTTNKPLYFCDLCAADFCDAACFGGHDLACVGRRAARGLRSPAQRAKFRRVMREYKKGKLHSGSKKGPVVRDRDQALAIAYAEARKV